MKGIWAYEWQHMPDRYRKHPPPVHNIGSCWIQNNVAVVYAGGCLPDAWKIGDLLHAPIMQTLLWWNLYHMIKKYSSRISCSTLISDCPVSDTAGDRVKRERSRAREGLESKILTTNVEVSQIEETRFRQEAQRSWLANRLRGFVGIYPLQIICPMKGAAFQFKASTSSFVEKGKLDAPRTVPEIDRPSMNRGRSRSWVRRLWLPHYNELSSASVGRASSMQYTLRTEKLHPQKPNLTI